MTDAGLSLDAYTRIALRMRSLSSADCEWLLSQLAAEDCRAVSSALQKFRARAPELHTAVAPAVPESRSAQANSPSTPLESEDPYITRLRIAKPTEIKQVLASQESWAIALVLSAQQWPWAPEFLGSLPPERIRLLRSLAHDLPLQVKPRFRAKVLQWIAMKLEAAGPAPHFQPHFETALERALGARASSAAHREQV